MASPDQISNKKLADSASDLAVKSKQADGAQERDSQATIRTELNLENVNNEKVPEVASKKKEKIGFQIPPGQDTALHVITYFDIIDLQKTKIAKKIQMECGKDKREPERKLLARLCHDEYHLDYLAERWAKNYYRLKDPVSIMESLEYSHRLIEGMINRFEERLEGDDKSLSNTEDSESESSTMSDKEEQGETRPDGFGASALSEANYHDTLMKKRINEDFPDFYKKKVEERVQRGVRSRELAYGSADLDLDIFASRLGQHKGPEWLGQEGSEQMTKRWQELDAQARDDIDAYEAAINALHNPTPGERLTHSEIRHSCTCGQSCWIKQAACLRASSFITRHLDRAERDAAYRDERSDAEQARFTCKVKQFVQHLECRLDIGEQIDDELQNFLREIVAHSERTYRDDEKHQAIHVTKRFVLDGSAESVKLYCRWLRRNPKVEVDSELVESARSVLKRAALMKQEETEPSNATAAHLFYRGLELLQFPV
jgi:hypothetical protein